MTRFILQHIRFGCLILLGVSLMKTLVLANGQRPGYTDQPTTGTTDPNGKPNRQSGTITSQTGNSITAPTPVGTDPSASPANRNPYNDQNYRPGTPGASATGSQVGGDPRFSQGNPSTLGTAAPADDNRRGAPGINGVTGQTNRDGSAVGALSGNPGPTGNASAPSAARTTGSVGSGGSGSGGAPGAISNSGTHGINGSGH